MAPSHSHPIRPPGQPDGSATAVRIFGTEGEELEAVCNEQVAIVLGIKAGVVQGFAFEMADGFTSSGAAVEKQRRAGQGVGGEDRKHGRLVCSGQVEETVPRQHATEPLAESQLAHVREMCCGMRQVAAELGEQFR